MGIDKRNVRWVAHWNYVSSLESYYQEAGRAGRDGERARAVLLYRPADRSTVAFLAGARYPRREELLAAWMEVARATPGAVSIHRIGEACGIGERRARVVAAMLDSMEVAERRGGKLRKLREFSSDEEWNAFLTAYERRHEADRERLRSVVRYAQTALCRVRYLREYFGEETGEPCGHCDNCLTGTARRAIDAARRSLRAHEKPGLPSGVELMPKARTPFEPGEPVRHRRFGLGEVRRAEGAKVTVAFARGEKKVDASYLERVSQ
jgi:ATP-dependent DNA helicase RecQ